MICDHCGKNPATTAVKQTINGKTQIFHLCSSCAEHLQISNFFGNPFFSTSDLFSSFFQQMDARNTADTRQCPRCGTTLHNILSTGHLGCSECVKTFQKELLPTIRKIHGNAVHTGKVPQTAPVEIKTKRQIELLEEQLQKSIAQQDFEKAAELRDEINRLKG